MALRSVGGSGGYGDGGVAGFLEVIGEELELRIQKGCSVFGGLC